MNATVLSFDYPNRKLTIQIESNSPMLEVRESGVLLGYISLRDIADQLIEKEKKYVETARDHDQAAAKIEEKEYLQKKCVNCGHGVYSSPDNRLHESINAYGENDLNIKCNYCECQKPEPESERINNDFIKPHSNLCDCPLTPKHNYLEHDNCCQICGGSHSEKICPHEQCKHNFIEAPVLEEKGIFYCTKCGKVKE